jgi:Uma2 family endonuclease
MTQVVDMADIILQTDASGAPVRLEYVRGQARWEVSPASRHQKALQRIERSIRPAPGDENSCGCFFLADVLIRFSDPDHSLKRPDLSIFCTEPPDSDEALEILPDAVVEVISVGYEDKDLGQDGAPFYIEQAIADVIVFDPHTGVIHHYRPDQPTERSTSPIDITLACGCKLRV